MFREPRLQLVELEVEREREERERRRREEEALIAGMLLAGAYHLPGVGFNRNFDQEGCQ